MSQNMRGLIWLCALCLLISAVFVSPEAFAQGRGRGRGAGNPGGNHGMGNPGGGRAGLPGVDRGIDTSSEMSRGRADIGRASASVRSRGRSDAGLERARMRGENSRRADDILREHPQMPAKLHTTANDLRAGYARALAVDPELKFGQYVAASRLSSNLRGRHSNVTREALLAGLARGDSLGQTLQNLGVSKNEAREATKRIKKEVKESKKRVKEEFKESKRKLK